MLITITIGLVAAVLTGHSCYELHKRLKPAVYLWHHPVKLGDYTPTQAWVRPN